MVSMIDDVPVESASVEANLEWQLVIRDGELWWLNLNNDQLTPHVWAAPVKLVSKASGSQVRQFDNGVVD